MKKILLVDDDLTFVKLIQASLEQTGEYEVKVENRGVRAVEVARAYQPDLVLLDFMMPHMKGPAVAKTIRDTLVSAVGK